MKRFRQFGMAGLGVVVGIVLFNNLQGLAGNTAVGKLLDGRLFRGI